MTYIPPENRDTRYPLWFVRYEVSVPYIQTLDPDEMARYGVPTSGDPHHDHATMWEPIRTWMPIHRIAELWNEGAAIRIVNKKDTVAIYRAVEDHLQAWKRHIETTYNPTDVPEEDLLILDRFASEVYDKAAPFFTNKWVAANFKLVGRSPHSRRAIAKRIEDAERLAYERAQKDKDSGVLTFENIDVVAPAPKYDKSKAQQREQVDYSGAEYKPDVEPRRTLTSFLRRK